MGILKSYKTIATIEVKNGALVINEPITVSVNAKTTIWGLIFLGAVLFFIGWKAYVHFESSAGTIIFIIAIYVLALYSRRFELSCIMNKRQFFIISKSGITYNTFFFHWEEIDKVEFLKDKSNDGFNYIRLHLVNNDIKDLAYPESATPEFEQLASQLMRLETKFYV